MNDDPDKYSNARIWQLFRGFEHQLTRMNSDWVDLWEAVEKLRTQMESLLESKEADAAKIGELQESLDAVSQRMDKAAEVVRVLKKGGDDG